MKDDILARPDWAYNAWNMQHGCNFKFCSYEKEKKNEREKEGNHHQSQRPVEVHKTVSAAAAVAAVWPRREKSCDRAHKKWNAIRVQFAVLPIATTPAA